MWRILLFVLVVSYTMLVVLLRSLVVPLKAIIVNLLSVAAAYGVLVAVFQWGWLDSVLGLDSPGYVDPTVPPIVLALVFGLSMDYEVFLLSRIRERFDTTGYNRTAVAEGLASSARPITSAAAIMVAVFAAFFATGIPAIQMMGLGGAVAVALDATLVRLVLVPATMTLLGDRNRGSLRDSPDGSRPPSNTCQTRPTRKAGEPELGGRTRAAWPRSPRFGM